MIGAISFSTYLLHHPIIDLIAAHTTWRDRPVMFLAVTWILTIGAATITFRLIERPARRYLKTLATPSPVAAAVAT